MKQITLLLATSALLFSCRKTTCTPPVTPATTLVGCWFGSDNSSICFTDSLISKDTEPFYPYATTKDSIYYLLDDGSKFAQYGYTLVNDTLKLYPTLHHPNAPFTYWN